MHFIGDLQPLISEFRDEKNGVGGKFISKTVSGGKITVA